MGSTDEPMTRKQAFQEGIAYLRRISAGWAATGAALGFMFSFIYGDDIKLEILLLFTALGGLAFLAFIWWVILSFLGFAFLFKGFYTAFNFIFQLRVILALLFAIGIYYSIKYGLFSNRGGSSWLDRLAHSLTSAK